MRERTHGLHAFCILRRLSFFPTVRDVPILGSSNRHIHHLHRHLERLKSGCSAAATTDGNGSSGFVLQVRAVGEERPLHDCQQRTVGLTVIHRRSEDEAIRLREFRRDGVAYIVVKDTSTVALRLAGSASDAAADGFVANPDDF